MRVKLGIAGKGGTGKTTVVGTMARHLARMGHRVVVFDVDPHPTLGTTIGIEAARMEVGRALPPDLLDALAGSGPKVDLDDLIERYGLQGPDGITMLIAHRLDHVEMHCNSAAHATVRAILRDLVQRADDVALVDMEAGVEHFSRAGGTLAHADGLMVMVEPFHKSLVTGRQVAMLAAELGIPHRYVVANKVRNDADLKPVEDFCAETGLELLGVVPWDPTVQSAETRGLAPYDFCPDSPAVVGACSIAVEALHRLHPAGSPAAT